MRSGSASAERFASRGADTRPFSEELVWEQLKTVYDPEIPVNIADLGLIYVCDRARPCRAAAIASTSKCR